jgi:uncharacterized tellurite resistance protein B-like protein
VDDRLAGELVAEIREFLATEGAGLFAREAGLVTGRGLQVAAALLMVSMIRADRANRLDEYRVLARAVAALADATPDEALALVRAAEQEIERGDALAASVARLDTRCTREQKMRLVESLWRLAFADAELQGHEEYLVRKLAGLLHLSTADLIEAKVRGREGFLREDL